MAADDAPAAVLLDPHVGQQDAFVDALTALADFPAGIDRGDARVAYGDLLDHLGFDVKDLKAFIKMLEANNIKLDRPLSVNNEGIGIAFITDPWGAYLEINERPGPM